MNKAFKIVMMNKQEIQIDADEVSKVIKAISTNSPAILKQAIFNPSSYSHIVEDKSRGIAKKEVNELGHYTGKVEMHYVSLPDIFSEIQELAKLKDGRI